MQTWKNGDVVLQVHIAPRLRYMTQATSTSSAYFLPKIQLDGDAHMVEDIMRPFKKSASFSITNQRYDHQQQTLVQTRRSRKKIFRLMFAAVLSMQIQRVVAVEAGAYRAETPVYNPSSFYFRHMPPS